MMQKNRVLLQLAKTNKTQFVIVCLFIIGMLLTIWVYRIGLDSRFVLDDEANLQNLTKIQAQPGLETTLFYISQGAAGLLGRPVSSLSFAMQFHDWPNNPAAFKYINLMLHLLIACLIYIFLQQVIASLKITTNFYQFVPAIVTIIWLLHPMQVTTVLYTVQRMTQLSALFTLLGLVCYLKGRLSLTATKALGSYGYALIGIVLCGSLAVFSKENGALLLLYIALLELTILQQQTRTAAWNKLLLLFIVIPLAFALVYLIINFQTLIIDGYAEKPFTLSERLLTESRVVLQYGLNLFIPQPSAYGLYHDNITISTSLLTPISTLFACLFLLALFITVIKFRTKYPLACFAIAWFFIAHSLESSIFPLELYFEHRNYLAIIGPAILFSITVIMLYHKLQSPICKPALVSAAAAWLVLLPLVTKQEADLWSKPNLQAKIWSQENPGSVRAQLASAVVWAAENNAEQVQNSFRSILKQFPDNTGILLSLVGLSCLNPNFSPETIEQLIVRMKLASRNYGFVHLADNAVRLKEQNHCKPVSLAQFHQIFTVLLQNQALKPKHAYVYLLRGRINLMLGHLVSALNDFESSYKIHASVSSALYLTQTCELLRNYTCALHAIDKAWLASQKRLFDKLAYEKTIKQIKTRLKNLVQGKTTPPIYKNNTIIFN